VLVHALTFYACIGDICFALTGPEGTPYAYGCFFFDLFLPDYPQSPPKVQFLTTGGGAARFNPNLYECGKVCLSLLGTWSGPGWIPQKSTILQVLVSIQGLILVSDPYYNEPSYETARGTKAGKTCSDQYNKSIRRYTVQYAIAAPLQQAVDTIAAAAAAGVSSLEDPAAGTATGQCHSYPEFAQAIVCHFALQATALTAQLQEWTKRDRYLQTWIPTIQKNLAIVVSAYEQQVRDPMIDAAAPSAMRRKRSRADDKKVAPTRRPDQELIELLDD
jgi:ubiquitin-protein ligase